MTPTPPAAAEAVRHTRWRVKDAAGKYLSAEGWKVDRDDARDYSWVPIKDGRRVVALVLEEGLAPARMKFEAELLAAAPDLLAALVALLPNGWANDDTMDHMPGVKAARAAIARATGAAP